MYRHLPRRSHEGKAVAQLMSSTNTLSHRTRIRRVCSKGQIGPLFFSRRHCNNQRVVLHTKGIVGILVRNTPWRLSCSIVISRPNLSRANLFYSGRATTRKWKIPWPRSTTLSPALSKRLHPVRRYQSPSAKLFGIVSSSGDRIDRRGHRGEAWQRYRRKRIWIWGGQRVPRLQWNWLIFRGWGLRRLQQQRFMRLGCGGLLRVSKYYWEYSACGRYNPWTILVLLYSLKSNKTSKQALKGTWCRMVPAQ